MIFFSLVSTLIKGYKQIKFFGKESGMLLNKIINGWKPTGTFYRSWSREPEPVKKKIFRTGSATLVLVLSRPNVFSILILI